MMELLFPSIYATAFTAAVLARSWRALVISVLCHVVLIAGTIMLVGASSGFMLFVFSFPIVVFAVGSIAGHATRLCLLLANQRVASGAGLVIVAVGAVVLPLAWEGPGLYTEWKSNKAYAELPKATTVAEVPACSPFSDSSPLLDAVLVRQPADRVRDGLPPSEVNLRYPSSYLEPFPPRLPQSGLKTSRISFEMYVDDASPAPREDEHDGDGKPIPLVKRRPSVFFDFSADIPTPRSAVRLLNTLVGNFSGTEAAPPFRVVPAAVPGLDLVDGSEFKSAKDTELYVVAQENDIVEYIQCSGRGLVPNPQCLFRFDAGPIPVSGRFRLADLSEWRNMRENIRRFAECSRARAADIN
jgi:hypothetical protein